MFVRWVRSQTDILDARQQIIGEQTPYSLIQFSIGNDFIPTKKMGA
jgi:hypothetical protein